MHFLFQIQKSLFFIIFWQTNRKICLCLYFKSDVLFCYYIFLRKLGSICGILKKQDRCSRICTLRQILFSKIECCKHCPIGNENFIFFLNIKTFFNNDLRYLIPIRLFNSYGFKRCCKRGFRFYEFFIYSFS